MAYTAFEEMKKINDSRFKPGCGPFQPEFYNNGAGNDLKTAALRFIREACEELRFGPKSVEDEVSEGVFQGASLKEHQIPLNMQRDADRLCLEKTLEHFIDSGTAEDAYEVYYCYLEIFIGAYGQSKSMIELLSEFEMNGSAVIMKHRDHYSHSVYVFALGLAIYETNEKYRRVFAETYAQPNPKKAAHLFLEFWGLTALFHDIGYPFELPFEQAMSYFEIDKTKRDAGIPFLAYNSLQNFIALSGKESEHFKELYSKDFSSITEILAFDIAQKLGGEYGFTEEYILKKINDKPGHPEDFNYFMDHAFFSATRLYGELVESLGVEKLGKIHIDALSAIMLHNSLFKFNIVYFKNKEKKKAPLSMELHPLAFLLMLCDELQCWDRTAYGRNSRTILYPMSADFDFSNGAIQALYHYDEAQKHKISAFEKQQADYQAGLTDKKPKLKSYSEMVGENSFVSEINDIVDLSRIPFTAVPDTRKEDRSRKHTFLSSSSFIHLYDFAVLLSVRRKLENAGAGTEAERYYADFDKLSLEYKIQHLDRAKHFSRYLNAIGCFYTDKPVDFDLLAEFSTEQAEIIAPLEHERWLRSRYDAGWVYGDEYEFCRIPADADEKPERQKIREQMRCHKLMINGDITAERAREHFASLPLEEQDKDLEPLNWMLYLIHTLDGVKIYSI